MIERVVSVNYDFCVAKLPREWFTSNSICVLFSG